MDNSQNTSDEPKQRLVLIGNGFDLAHGLKTTYKDFLNWYMCQAYDQFLRERSYEDELLNLRYTAIGYTLRSPDATCSEDVVKFMSSDPRHTLSFKTKFLEYLVKQFITGTWVNIEYQYFHWLKKIFKQPGSELLRHKNAVMLNQEFDIIIQKLSQYMQHVNMDIHQHKKLPIENYRLNIVNAFIFDESRPITFINFNYTDTLQELGYTYENEVIHIHGRASSFESNPIIFGYGDETDSTYQLMEDANDNIFLDHIKSFGYFRVNNYSNLIRTVDSKPYDVYIVGHSCGLSDRILLNQIFEHKHCDKIHVFYHRKKDNTDNFKEITQEISRHFKPQNKGIMRQRVADYDPRNLIPQKV